VSVLGWSSEWLIQYTFEFYCKKRLLLLFSWEPNRGWELKCENFDI